MNKNFQQSNDILVSGNNTVLEHSKPIHSRNEQNSNQHSPERPETMRNNSIDFQDRSFQKTDRTLKSSHTETVVIQKSSIFKKTAQQKAVAQIAQLEIGHQEQQIPKVAELKKASQNDHVEELKRVIAKHMFINKWYQGPTYDRENENYFMRDDKILIIEDDDDEIIQDRLEDRAEILSGLIAQKIKPTNFILGDKQMILDKMKAEEVRKNKIKKENETKKLIKSSDVKMTIYPAYDNFFKKQQQ